MSSGILSRIDGAIGVIEISRPERRNALNAAAMEGLSEALSRLSQDESCRVIVIRGQGAAFCSGWDVSDFPALAALGEQALAERFERNAAVLDRLERCPKITVAGVRGPCLGIGFSLLARADVSLASDTAMFGLPELKHGVVPGMVMEDAIRVLGARRATDWILSCRLQTTANALAAGLVGEAVADGEFEARLTALADALARVDPAAVAASKALMRALTQGGAGRAAAVDASVRSVTALIPKV